MQGTSEKESVGDLLGRTRSDTLLVPLYKLQQRLGRPISPLSKGKSVSQSSADECTVKSYDSGLSYSSFMTNSSMDIALRDRIKDLENKIKAKSEGDELPKVKISPSMCSWDHRVAKKYRNRQRPPVNIIACHQPSDLIVARADDRVRKQVHAKELREKHLEDLTEYINNLIKLKLTRGERYAKLIELQDRQSKFLKLICAVNYIKFVAPMIQVGKRRQDEHRHVNKAARFLQRGMTVWYEDRVNTRYTNFERVISKFKWRLQLVISIAQKRRACKIIRFYLNHRKDKRGKMSAIIHQFILGVRRIQRMARGFLECKMYRIRSLEKIWLDLEKQYIYATMAVKRAEVSQAATNKMQNLVIDTKTRIEMEKQNERWDFTSKKFDRILDQHRAKGDLDVSMEADGIESVLISPVQRKTLLESMLRQKRKEHILKVQDMQSQLKTSCMFSEDDALSFLKGDINPGLRLNMSEHAQYAVKVLCPFNVYKTLADEDFLVRIRKIHDEKRTFEITPQNVNLFNAALQNQNNARRNASGERVIIRRSASFNLRAYEEHDAILRAKLATTLEENRKEKEADKKKRASYQKSM